MNKTNELVSQIKGQERKTPIATNMFIPNHSGDHSRGLVRDTPSNNLSIVNKKYCTDTFEPILTKYNLTGTTNQVNLSASGTGVLLARNVQLSTPQDIATTSSPSFANVTVNSSGLVKAQNAAGTKYTYISTDTDGWSNIATSGAQIKITGGSSNIMFLDDAGFTFGVATGTRANGFNWSESYDQFVLAMTADLGRQFIITDYTSRVKDHDHAVPTNPTLFIHDATDVDVTNNKWGSLHHDGTDYIITSGANTGAGTSPATIQNDIVFSPRGTEAARAVAGGYLKPATAYKSSDGSTGVSGSFTTTDGKTITVKDGIITAIV